MMICQRYCFLGMLLIIPCLAFSQNKVSLSIQSIDKDTTFLQAITPYQNTFVNTVALKKELNRVVTALQGKGFLLSSVDSLYYSDDNYTAELYIGNTFKWATLTNGNIPTAFLEQIGFKEKLYANKPFSVGQVVRLQEDILKYAENHGFPFAQVWLGDVVVDKEEVSAKIYYRPNRLILFDELTIEGDANISETYIRKYLGIEKGGLYNESKVASISKRIAELPFLKEKRGVGIVFLEDKADLTLFLDKKRASRFDFLIGFLPRSDETGRLVLTGSLQAEMQNALGAGEIMGLDWQQLRPETSRLEAKFAYPYILNLPFGVDSKLGIYRRDSTFRDVQYDVGVQYLFEGNNYLKVFVENVSSDLLSVNEAQIIQQKKLPSVLDVSNTTFGLAYQFQQLDYRFNPRKGINLKIRGGVVTKRIRENNLITELVDASDPSFDYGTLYQNLNLQSFQLRTNGQVDKFWAIGDRGTIKTGIQGGLLMSQDSIYQNELYRIGGNRILRGFDEQSILASTYGIATLEYRFLIGQNSYLYTFLDYGFIDRQSVGDKLTDFPYGLGAGMSFETSAGIIGITLAVGSQQGNALDFRSSKIHFGYVNYF